MGVIFFCAVIISVLTLLSCFAGLLALSASACDHRLLSLISWNFFVTVEENGFDGKYAHQRLLLSLEFQFPPQFPLIWDQLLLLPPMAFEDHHKDHHQEAAFHCIVDSCEVEYHELLAVTATQYWVTHVVCAVLPAHPGVITCHDEFTGCPLEFNTIYIVKRVKFNISLLFKN